MIFTSKEFLSAIAFGESETVEFKTSFQKKSADYIEYCKENN